MATVPKDGVRGDLPQGPLSLETEWVKPRPQHDFIDLTISYKRTEVMGGDVMEGDIIPLKPKQVTNPAEQKAWDERKKWEQEQGLIKSEFGIFSNLAASGIAMALDAPAMLATGGVVGLVSKVTKGIRTAVAASKAAKAVAPVSKAVIPHAERAGYAMTDQAVREAALQPQQIEDRHSGENILMAGVAGVVLPPAAAKAWKGAKYMAGKARDIIAPTPHTPIHIDAVTPEHIEVAKAQLDATTPGTPEHVAAQAKHETLKAKAIEQEAAVQAHNAEVEARTKSTVEAEIAKMEAVAKERVKQGEKAVPDEYTGHAHEPLVIAAVNKRRASTAYEEIRAQVDERTAARAETGKRPDFNDLRLKQAMDTARDNLDNANHSLKAEEGKYMEQTTNQAMEAAAANHPNITTQLRAARVELLKTKTMYEELKAKYEQVCPT